MATVGLAMITNDAEATIAILNKYGHHFDKWFITVADKNKKQLDKFPKNEKLHLSYFKWCDSFGKARQFNHQQIDTDLWMWIDSDDEIENPERIPELVDYMVKSDLDAVYLEYKYMQNDLGEQVAPHWRERMIRTGSMFKWANNRCHETLIAPNAKTVRWDGMAILHNKNQDEQNNSMLRNIKLLKLDFEETQDPRTAMYLADNLMYLKEFDKAIECFAFLLKNGGWEEDKYRAWLRVAEIKYQQEKYGEALDACAAAEDLLPNFPDSYFLKASIYNAMNMPKKVFEWVKVGMMKPVPDTMSVYDPTLYEYRGVFMGALAALELGQIDDAWQMYQIVRKRSPNYPLALEMKGLFEEAYYDSEAIKKTKWLLYYSKDNGGDVSRLLGGLPSRLVADPRLNADRAKLLPKRKWPTRSIVFYCGRSTEAWGPDTLGKGMGGSEEAIVYLTRELVKLGWEVTVFNDREEELVSEGVTFKPWTLLNPWDEYDVFIAWRAPTATTGVKARIKGVDLHDTPIGHQNITEQDVENTDLYFFKTEYQTTYAPQIPKEKIVVIPNGIKGDQFNGA